MGDYFAGGIVLSNTQQSVIVTSLGKYRGQRGTRVRKPEHFWSTKMVEGHHSFLGDRRGLNTVGPALL